MWIDNIVGTVATWMGLGPLPFALIITIICVVLLISPIDLMPELFLGPIGLADDVLYVAIIVITWGTYFSWAFLAAYFNENPIIGSIAILVFILIFTFIFRKIGAPIARRVGFRSRSGRTTPHMISYRQRPLISGKPTNDYLGIDTFASFVDIFGIFTKKGRLKKRRGRR